MGDGAAASLDRQDAEAMTAGDAAMLEALWSDRLVVTPPGGMPADKATAIRLVQEGLLAYREVARSVERVIDQHDVVITVGSERVTSLQGDEQLRRYTHVWGRESGSWRLLARHASPA